MIFRPPSLIAFSCLLSLLLACPGPIEKMPLPPPPDPAQAIYHFSYVGPNEAIAGEWRMHFMIDVTPWPFSAPTRYWLEGPGSLSFDEAPLDLTRTFNQPSGGLEYLPPLEVPPEGITVKVGCEIYAPETNRWDKSGNFEIKVVPKTTPMMFWISEGESSEMTVKIGQKATFGCRIRPYPATRPVPSPPVLSGPAGYTGPLGTVVVDAPVDDGSWRWIYTAPDRVTNPIDVQVRSQVYDPWIKATQEAVFIIHLQP